jgi:hypothetical protein
MRVKPDEVGVLMDVLPCIHAVDGGRAADADLLGAHEDGQEFQFAPLFLRPRREMLAPA